MVKRGPFDLIHMIKRELSSQTINEGTDFLAPEIVTVPANLDHEDPEYGFNELMIDPKIWNDIFLPIF